MSSSAEHVPQGAIDPSTKEIFLWFATITYWIAWPIYLVFYHLFNYTRLFLAFCIRLVLEPLSYILAPLFYLARFLLACLQAPFRFLARFETLYIYLSIGALVGLSGGLLLSLAFSSLQKPLGLDRRPRPSGRTARQYREEKRIERAKKDPHLSATTSDVPSGYFSLSDGARKGTKVKGLLSQTIMEELDSDY